MEKQEKLRRETSPSKQPITSESQIANSPCQSLPLHSLLQSPLNCSSCPASSSKPSKPAPGPGCDSWTTNSSFPLATTLEVIAASSSQNQEPYFCNNNNVMTSASENVLEVEQKRKKRNWEVWSQDDKQHFFEALNEFGKDFDAIQTYLASKLKSRKIGSSSSSSFVPKNKDQVRHFYYRTWHKIAKHLKFPKGKMNNFTTYFSNANFSAVRFY